MARRFATAIDLQQNELQRARIQNVVADPAGVEGQIIWRSDTDELKIYNGAAWITLPIGAITSAMIQDGTIVNADVAVAAAIARSKLDFGAGLVNADIATGAAITYAKLSLALGIVNGDINAAAAIAYSKLNLTTSIVNGDIAVAAAIAYSKLALANTIVNADINTAAAIAYSKLNLALSIVNGDISASAAIARSKLDFGSGLVNADLSASAAIALSKLATDPLARANHTGTQLAATISNFDTQVRTSRLDQMAVPTVDVAMGAKKITGLADGTVAQDAVTLAQLQAVSSGMDVKASCRAATTGVITLASPGATIDGVAMAAGERVLVKDQSAAPTPNSANGIYVWNGAAVPMTRAADADSNAEVTAGLFTFVSEGTVNADSGWYLSTNNPIVLNTTPLLFVQFSGAGQITAGNGLTKNGNTLDVGAGAGLTVAADTVLIGPGQVVNSMVTSIDAAAKLTGATPVANGGTAGTTPATARTGLVVPGRYDNGATHVLGTTITIPAATHGLGTGRNKVVQVIEEATGDVIITDVNIAANGDVVVGFATSQAANSHRVLIMGW